jgi:hypothetical protein
MADPGIHARPGNPALLEPLLVDPFMGRSGSTLVMKILGSSPAIAFDRAYPYENRYLTYLCRFLDQVDGRLPAPPEWSMMALLRGSPYEIGPLPFSPTALDPQDLVTRLTWHVWAALSESFLARSGEYRYYAEKTPGEPAETVARAGIAIKLINLVRDPRDVVASIRAFDQKRGFFGFGRTPGQTEAEYLRVLASDMRRNLDRMQERARRHDHFWVRYEDLVTAPETVVDPLADWLDVRLRADVVHVRDEEYERHTTTPSPDESVGRWRQRLSAEEAAHLEDALSDHMARLGYE